MDSTHQTTTESTEAQAVVVNEKRVREVLVNYRGPKKESVKIDAPMVAAHHIRKLLPDNSREHFVALFLDAANSLIGYAVVSTGIANACLAHPREVFQRAILVGAVSVILGHNHPSGRLVPSDEDHRVTRLMREGGDLLGIKVLDHIIVNATEHNSFREAESH